MSVRLTLPDGVARVGTSISFDIESQLQGFIQGRGVIEYGGGPWVSIATDDRFSGATPFPWSGQGQSASIAVVPNETGNFKFRVVITDDVTQEQFFSNTVSKKVLEAGSGQAPT